jgi:hypothetical protein
VRIEVHADNEATPAELEAIEAAFRRAGFLVETDAALRRRSTDPLSWLIYVVIGAPVAKFFTTLAGEAAKDAYPAIKRWASALFAARRGRGGVVLLDDEHNRLTLGSEIPDEAIAALAELDWTELRGGDLHWSGSRRAWLDVFKNPDAF